MNDLVGARQKLCDIVDTEYHVSSVWPSFREAVSGLEEAVRRSVIDEIRSHSERTSLSIVIDPQVLTIIEHGICPKPENHG